MASDGPLNNEIVTKLLIDVATLLERSLTMQKDLAETRDLVLAQNGRVKKLEDELLTSKTTKKLLLGIAAGIGSVVTFLGNLFLGGLGGNGR